MLHDQDRCVNCFSCEVHCKLEKSLPVGPRLIRIIQVGPRLTGGRLSTTFVAMQCNHCDPVAPCAQACPTGACQKREDGIVFIEEAACIGCKSCIYACPFGAPQFNPQTKKVVKCDYCMDRVDAGFWPACATSCSTKALHFGNINAMSTMRRQREARRIAAAAESGGGSWDTREHRHLVPVAGKLSAGRGQ
ncbi:MAG: 4Fe-4S binding protein [Thermoleophilia bacterium]|nr:4Fe-4S binding protein [Thermoleophilia bacterium]